MSEKETISFRCEESLIDALDATVEEAQQTHALPPKASRSDLLRIAVKHITEQELDEEFEELARQHFRQKAKQ